MAFLCSLRTIRRHNWTVLNLMLRRIANDCCTNSVRVISSSRIHAGEWRSFGSLSKSSTRPGGWNAGKHKAMSYKRMNETEARLKQEIDALLAVAEKTDAEIAAQRAHGVTDESSRQE